MAIEYDRVSYVFSQEEIDGLNQDIASIQSRLSNVVVNLSPEMRRLIASMGDGSHPFVEYSLKYAHERPEFIPGFVDINEFQNDWDLAMQLKDLQRKLQILLENVNDTLLAAGADAFAHARYYYEGAKAGKKANMAGADTVVDNLKKRFNRGRKPSTPEEPGSTAPSTSTTTTTTTTSTTSTASPDATTPTTPPTPVTESTAAEAE
jgi:cell division septation protein DedD